MGENDGKARELISQMTPEQLAELKVKNDELIRRANKIIDESKNMLNNKKM